MKRVLVAENDKLVPVPACRDAAPKTTSTHVACLRQAGIPVLYSCDKGKQL
jgi:nicotinamidase-related amidase